jgi:hypothetical protein
MKRDGMHFGNEQRHTATLLGRLSEIYKCKNLTRGRNSSSGGFFFEKLFLTVNERINVVRRELEAMTVRDGIGGARFHAITAENAPRIVDVIHTGIALTRGDAVRMDILGGFDIDAIRGASGRAEKASNALLQAILVAVQNVNPTVARLKMDRLVRIILRHRLTKHSAEGYAEAFYQRAKRLANFPDNRCHGLESSKRLWGGQTGPVRSLRAPHAVSA